MEWLLIAILSTSSTELVVKERFMTKQECIYVGNHLVSNRMSGTGSNAKCFEVNKIRIKR